MRREVISGLGEHDRESYTRIALCEGLFTFASEIVFRKHMRHHHLDRAGLTTCHGA